MGDFVFWNVVFAIAWVVWRVVWWLLPRGTTFAVRSVSRSRIHGWIGEILINDQRHTVFRQGTLWRYTKDGRVLPGEWQEELNACASSNS